MHSKFVVVVALFIYKIEYFVAISCFYIRKLNKNRQTSENNIDCACQYFMYAVCTLSASHTQSGSYQTINSMLNRQKAIQNYFQLCQQIYNRQFEYVWSLCICGKKTGENRTKSRIFLSPIHLVYLS